MPARSSSASSLPKPVMCATSTVSSARPRVTASAHAVPSAADAQALQNSGKLTVVPMVENANILSTLWQAGANYIQGYYLQEPSTEMDYDFSTEE